MPTNCLIDERAGGAFIGVTDRTMQAMRQRGDGPRYIVISARCIRYRWIDLKDWADSRLRISTADPGPNPQPADAGKAAPEYAPVGNEPLEEAMPGDERGGRSPPDLEPAPELAPAA